jgi:iron complex outermembrane receptor protein
MLLATSMLVMPLLTAPASAQQAPVTSGGIPEIVVTAQRKAESLTQVPISIQAMSGSQLNDSGIRDLADLGTQVPGYLPSKGSGYTQVFIRGIGNSVYVGADPSVATYIDDVPRIYGSMVSQLVDVDRVEVLKGAQGGLYGRNATGGVINIITHQPDTDKFSGHGLFDYGEYNYVRAAAVVNIPISSNVAVLVAAEHDRRDDMFKNIAPLNPYTASMFPNGSILGTCAAAICPLNSAATANYLNANVRRAKGQNQDFSSGDFKVLIKPSDVFKITIAGDYSNKQDSDGGVIQQVTPANNQIFLGGILAGFAPGSSLPPGFLVGSTSHDNFAAGSPTPVNNVDYGGSITAVYSAPSADFTSITAYRHQHTFFGTDLGGSSVPIDTVTVNNKKHFFYQELRAVSTGEGPWHWIGGATYLNNHFVGDTNVYLLSTTVQGAVCNFCYASRTRPVQVIEDGTVYAQAGYDFTPELNVTASGRYLYEKNTTNFIDTEVPANNATLSTVEKTFIPSATISYKLGNGRPLDWFDEGNLYFRYARGWKAGGINPVANPNSFISAGAPLSSGEVFLPEKVNHFELGVKGSMYDSTVRLTASVFYDDYHDLQNSSAHATPQYQTAVILAIVNVAKAEIYGAEETLQIRVADPLTLGINAAYLHARYKAGVPASTVLEALPIAGTTMTNSPTWMASFSLNLDQPISDNFRLVGNFVESYVDDVIFNFANADILGNPQPAPTGPAYWLTNLRLGVATADDKYEISFFANNLFNKYYLTQGTSASANGIQLEPGNPRILGGEISIKF